MKRLLLLVAICAACKQAPRGNGEPQPQSGEALLSPPQLETLRIAIEQVQEREVGGQLVTSGKVAFDDLRVAHVFSPVTGRVTSIRGQLGQRVEKGAPLAGIQPPDLGQVTQEYLLRAPIEGEIIARNVNPGTEVQGQHTRGTSLEMFTIGSLDEVWVLADVFEVDLARVKVGAPVSVSVIAYPDRKFTGRVDWISGSLDPGTRTARVRCNMPNPDRELRPEMYATVSVGVPTVRALTIPRDAILRFGNQTVVIVALGKNESGLTRFARRVVKVDETVTGDFLPVKRGLNPGDTIVVHGGLLLSGLI
jgi:multidrug efflux pump subunit AcrA (membrane-fusion protein)